MDVYNLHKKIDLVLAEEVRAYSANGRIGGGLGSMNVTLQTGVPNLGYSTRGEIPQLLFDTSDPNVISSPNSNILLKLYSSLDGDGKRSFETYLIAHLRKDSPYAEVAYLNLFVLYKVGALLRALNAAMRTLPSDEKISYDNMLAMLSLVISREYLEIDPETYEKIKLMLQRTVGYDFWLEKKVNLALLKHLERDLNDVNPEINIDRDKVLEIWGRKFSNPDVPALIREIDENFRDGEFSPTKLATCIGRIRVLIVEVSKRMALSAAQSKGDNSIDESSDEHHFFQYLKNQGFINDNEWNVLRSLYGLASDDGAHSLTSNREYARLIKNMAYELILLFLSKYEI